MQSIPHAESHYLLLTCINYDFFPCSLLLRVVARGAAAGGRAEHDVDLVPAADVAAGGADRAGRRPDGLLPRHDAGRRHQGEYTVGNHLHQQRFMAEE